MIIDYMPTTEPELDDWFQNFSVKMTQFGSSFGFTGDEISRVEDDAVVVHAALGGSANANNYRDEFIAYKRLVVFGKPNVPSPNFPSTIVSPEPTVRGSVASGIVERTRTSVRRMKTMPAYNEVIGADFQVISTTVTRAIGEIAKPVLKPKVKPLSIVEVVFVRGESDGLELELQRGTDTVWQKVGRFAKSPVIDQTPPAIAGTPEQRRYRGRYIEGNTPVGNFSDIVVIVTEP
jgi:hypothetical protein